MPSPRRARARSRPGGSTSRSGWPTNSTGTPAASYIAGSKGNTARTRLARRAMSRTRRRRQAHTWGGMKNTTGTPARRAWRARRMLNSGKSMTTRTRAGPRGAGGPARYVRYSAVTRPTPRSCPPPRWAVGSANTSMPSAAIAPRPCRKAAAWDPGRGAPAERGPCKSPEVSPAESMMAPGEGRLTRRPRASPPRCRRPPPGG